MLKGDFCAVILALPFFQLQLYIPLMSVAAQITEKKFGALFSIIIVCNDWKQNDGKQML